MQCFWLLFIFSSLLDFSAPTALRMSYMCDCCGLCSLGLHNPQQSHIGRSHRRWRGTFSPKNLYLKGDRAPGEGASGRVAAAFIASLLPVPGQGEGGGCSTNTMTGRRCAIGIGSSFAAQSARRQFQYSDNSGRFPSTSPQSSRQGRDVPLVLLPSS